MEATMRLAKIYNAVETKIGNVFARFGRFIARHPVKVIIIVIIINCGLGIGMVKIQQESNTEDIYIPTGTQARKDRIRIENLFPDTGGSNTTGFQESSYGVFAHVVVKSKTGNLLSRAVLEDVKRLDTYIKSITVVSASGNSISFDDICADYYGECNVDGDLFFHAEFLTAVDSNAVSYPAFILTTSGTENYESIIGGVVKTNEAGTQLEGMEYIWLKYLISSETQEIDDDMPTAWLDKFITAMEGFSSDYFDIAYAHSNSLDEELEENVLGDITWFALTITLMLTYAWWANMSARCDLVGQRVMLGFGGILAATLAILASFGFCSVIGVAFVSIVGVVPFLVIGIGIDDMFILLSGLSGAQDRKSVEERIGETLRTSGVGITITSLTDFLAFMAGSISNFLAVKNFCIYTGVAVVFCYINNVTLFTACMTINEKRVNDNRHFLTCRKTKSKEELKEEGKSSNYVFFCGGRPPTSREETESYLDRFPRWLFPNIVLRTPLKIVIILIFAGYLAASIYGCLNLKEGLEFKQLAAEDSYFYKYATWTQDYFKRYTPVSFVIDRTYTYSDTTVQSDVEALLSSAKSDSYFHDNFQLSWLASFKSSPYYDGSSETNFIAALQNFLNDPYYILFQNDVIIDTDNNKITASRVHVLSADMEDSQAEGRLMGRSREIAAEASINCFPYNYGFIFFEQYVAILPQTLQNVGIALAAVFVVTCLFMPHPLLILYCTVAVLMIMVGVFGFLYYVDVALSSITMIHLIMSIGFSVDFTAHICHGFMTANGETRHDRVRQAIDSTGAPIFHGFISSCLGIVVLAFANSYVFRTFAKVMALVLVFGIAHSLLLLTVVLSWIGPAKLNLVEDSTRSKEGQRSAAKSSQRQLSMNGVLANGYVSPIRNRSGETNFSYQGKDEINRRPTSVANSPRTPETKNDIYIAGTGLLDSSMGGLNFS